MTTKRESITRRLVDMLVKLSPEEVAEMLLETDPTWFELLVRERLNGKVQETTKQLMARRWRRRGDGKIAPVERLQPASFRRGPARSRATPSALPPVMGAVVASVRMLLPRRRPLPSGNFDHEFVPFNVGQKCCLKLRPL
jgi:hypothetical protein